MNARKEETGPPDDPLGNDSVVKRLNRLEIGVETLKEQMTKLDGRMERFETDLSDLHIEVRVIKATGATKDDVAECKTAIAEAKASIITWVAAAVFVAQLIPQTIRLIEKYLS